ncbi:ABC transporter permease subunit [Actinomadura graeca]|uniref:ABC transporter permease subunit n=1 Tax=Actinomadura graeca TaxID=2750812 RepID=A0ABX8R593_9ACTN|nr:ABC transporter permease subunit [Actinomadura graeca]QXJ26013.1 ABC transporter permease subunit [Actinomadura graeca]
MGDALAAEWWKLRSVRSTYWTLAAAAGIVLLVVLIALQAAHVWDGLPADERARFTLRPLQRLGPWAASLCLAVLGVLTATSEYRTGTIGTSLTAVPRRGRLLAAKAVVVGAVSLAAGEAAALASCLGTRLAVGGRPFPDQREPVLHDLPGFAVEGTSVAMFALLGLSLGLLLRSAAAAITTVVLIWHVLPLAVSHLPGPWNTRIGSVMPGGLAAQASGLTTEHSIYGDVLPPGVAAVMMLAYSAVPPALAALVFSRRDA